LATGLGTEFIVIVSGKLEAPMLLLTTRLNTRSTLLAVSGAVNVGDTAVELLSVTAGPDVWVHL
jgi:hypothetical protein